MGELQANYICRRLFIHYQLQTHTRGNAYVHAQRTRRGRLPSIVYGLRMNRRLSNGLTEASPSNSPQSP